MKFADLLLENVSSSLTNAGTVTLAGAPAGFRTLADVLADGDFVIGDKTTFKIMDEQGNWEFSTFQITNATTLTRVTIHRSSNIDNLVVTFPTGPKTIFNSPGGEWLTSLFSSLDPVETAVADLTTHFLPIAGPSGQKQISLSDLANAISKEPSTLPGLESAVVDSDQVLVLRSGELKRVAASEVKTYTGVADTSKPTLSGAQVANATPTKVVLTFSETLGAWTPAAAAFAVSGGKTISLVERSGATITLTVNTAYVYGDVITVTYTKPGSNALQDAAGNQVDSFGPSAVTNNVVQTVESIKPAASSAAVANASPSLVVITMSEPMDSAYDPAASAFTVSGHTVSAVDVTGSVINLTVTPAFVNGEAARSVSYTQPGTNQARDVAGNLLDTFASLAITNNVAAAGDTTKPTATAAAVANATPTVVNVTMSEPMDGSFDPAASAFTVSGHTVTAVDVVGSAINITVTPAFINGEAARTVSYTPPGTNNARDVAGNTLDAFTNLAITNNVAAASGGGSTYVARTTATPGGTAIAGALWTPTAVTFSKPASGDYYAAQVSGPRVKVTDSNGNAPSTVKFVWGTSPTVAPTGVTYASAELPIGATDNAEAKVAGIGLTQHYGGWTDGGGTAQAYYGVFQVNGSLFAYQNRATAANHLRYLWIYPSDGAAPFAYDNGTGSAIGWQVNV